MLPSEAIGQAHHLASSGEPEHGLVLLTETLCQRASNDAACQRGPGPPAQARTDAALVDAWVSLWDAAGRSEGPRRAVAKCYGSAPISLLLAVALADATGDWHRAVQLADERPNDGPVPLLAEIALRHAVALMHLGRTQEAIAELGRSIEAAPQHAGLRVALAQAYLAAGEPEKVVESVWPLLEQAEAPDGHLMLRARALVQAAREAAAPPMTPADAANHADLLRLTQSPEMTHDDLNYVRSLADESEQPQLYPWLAMILHKRGEIPRARALLERAQRLLPLDSGAPRLMAVQRLSSDDYDGALVALLEAARRDPFDIDVQQMLAMVAGRVGAWDHARGAYEALVRLAPDVPQYHEGLAQAQQHRSDQSPPTSL